MLSAAIPAGGPAGTVSSRAATAPAPPLARPWMPSHHAVISSRYLALP